MRRSENCVVWSSFTMHGRGKDSGVEIEAKYAGTSWTMQAGKATRFAGYFDWAEALEAVGLSE